MTDPVTLITCKDLAFGYDGAPAVHDVTLTVVGGDYLCVVGGNGSGKSTLIKGMLGLLKPLAGTLCFEPDLKPSDMGYLPQQNTIQRNFPASVWEVVLSGRLGRLGLSPVYHRADREAAREALAVLGVEGLAKSGFGELSGGQQQRVLLARTLCAATDGLKLLILDEPMNGLDASAKLELYAAITALNSQQGIAIIMVTHDVQAAVDYASHILVLEGRQAFFGGTHEFQHTRVGQELIRDSCGDACESCGMAYLATPGDNRAAGATHRTGER
ncbi:MAG: ABC transporter ATP-binding protein [Coriobacteriales bacterium]|jgi:zinc transport system ATP-binding protein|nr:ABC transporter ATP-binding protein [Coriobacteriales bacterium]